MHVLTPVALGRLAYPGHTWGRFHLSIQAHLLRLLTRQLRFPLGHPKAGQLCRRLMIRVPPQHGKSTLACRLLPAIALAQNPATRIIGLSYGADLIEGHSMAARGIVDQWGGTLCPSGALKLDPHARARNAWYTTAGGYMRVAAIMGGVTGLSADMLLIDDPIKDQEEAASVAVKNKVWDAYSSCAESRLSPDGVVCVVGTPWARDDLQGRLLESEADDWLVLRFPALAEHDDVLGRAPGEPLFPESGRSREWYEGTRCVLESRGQSHLWQSLWQCDPQGDPALCAFSDHTWFERLYVDDVPWEAGIVHRVLALDPSKSKTGKIGDYAAFADLSLLKNGNVYAQMHLSRPTLPVLYAQGMELITRAIDEGRPYTSMIVECNMFQQAVAVAFAERLAAARINLHVEEWQTGSNEEKNARIVMGLSPLLSRRKLKFVGETHSNRLTVTQTREIPNGAHDDGPDALELGVKMLNKMVFGRVQTGGSVLRVR